MDKEARLLNPTREKRARTSLRLRLAGLVLLAVLFPLPWAEHTSCNHEPVKIKTGIDIFFREGGGFIWLGIFMFVLVSTAIFDDRVHAAFRILAALSAAAANAVFGFILLIAITLNLAGTARMLAAGFLAICTVGLLAIETIYRLAFEIYIAWSDFRAKKTRGPPPDESITTIDN